MSMAPFDDRPFLLLCEGESDKRFFDQLIAKRGLENSFQVRFPHRGNDKHGGGRSKFGAWLDTAAQSEDFIQNIRAVLVVSDNDDDPAKSLEEVQFSLDQASDFETPNHERVVARSENAPPLVILMVPLDAPGNLETLCLFAAFQKWGIKPAVDIFTQSTKAKDWKRGKQSKMQLQCVIAATCEDRPEAGFAGHWRENEEFHVPLDHVAFDGIANFLIGLKAMIEAPVVENEEQT